MVKAVPKLEVAVFLLALGHGSIGPMDLHVTHVYQISYNYVKPSTGT